MTDFEKIWDLDNLYRAHLKSRLGKRDKREVIAFESRLAENLDKMSRELREGTYRMHGYYNFTIYEPKRRDIYAAHYEDRVMLHCLCDQVLSPLLERRLIFDNGACRVDKGTHFALDRFSGFLREHYRRHGPNGYVLKCDIRHYFPSIDHQILKEKLTRLIADPDVLRLAHHVVDSFRRARYARKGHPLGQSVQPVLCPLLS